MNIKTKRERKKEEYVRQYYESIIGFRESLEPIRFDNGIGQKAYEYYEAQISGLKQILKAFEKIDKNRP